MFTNDERPKTLQECFERLKKGCETLKEEYGYSDYAKFNPPLTEKEIQELQEYEKRLGFQLPEAYREFLKFSNGAIIDGLEIYELDMIGMPDDYVPDGYLPISCREMTSERLAISEEDGEIYIFWDFRGDKYDFKSALMDMLSECEGNIALAKKKKEDEMRTPEQIKKDEDDFNDFVERLKKSLELHKEKN